jgi:hypothetical protein
MICDPLTLIKGSYRRTLRARLGHVARAQRVPAVLLACAMAVLVLAITGQWGVHANVGP